MKTVCPKGRVGSNPTLSVKSEHFANLYREGVQIQTSCTGSSAPAAAGGFNRTRIVDSGNTYGEVPKLAEGTPLERVQVVNSGARVQIPPSPLFLKCRKPFYL